jgi:hypothetical protein
MKSEITVAAPPVKRRSVLGDESAIDRLKSMAAAARKTWELMYPEAPLESPVFKSSPL